MRPGGFILFRGLDGVEALAGKCVDREVLGVTTEHDVGTTTGHVRCNGDGALTASHRDDRGFALVVLRVEHLVRHAALLQQLGQVFGLLHARRTNEDRLALRMSFDDVFNHRAELRLLGLVDEIRLVDADDGAVGGNGHDFDAVGGVELRRLGLCRTGHPGEFFVQAEVVLQRNRGEGLVLRLDGDPFLRFDRLVHALVVAAPGQDTTGVLVNDKYLALEYHVILVSEI